MAKRPWRYLGRKSHRWKAHLLLYLANKSLHATLIRADLYTSESRRAGRHDNLVSTLCLTQCDTPPTLPSRWKILVTLCISLNEGFAKQGKWKSKIWYHMSWRGSNVYRKRFQVSTLHQSDVRRANSCEFRYPFTVVIWPWSTHLLLKAPHLLIGCLRFDDCNANNNSTNQWFDWLNEEK